MLDLFFNLLQEVVEQLMRDEQDKPYLKITQRLRLDQVLLLKIFLLTKLICFRGKIRFVYEK